MKTKVLPMVLFGIMFFSCSKQEPAFLSNFTSNFTEFKNVDWKRIYTKPIEPKDLEILLATNEVNEPLDNVDHKYFYGYKKKLDENHYLISFIDTYHPTYGNTNRMGHWEDEFLCIYEQDENKIISKLKIASADPIFSDFKISNGIYTVTTEYFKYVKKECADDPYCRDYERVGKTVVHQYKIIDNHFRCIDKKK